MSDIQLLEQILQSALLMDSGDDLRARFKSRLDDLDISFNQAESWLGITKKSLNNIFDGKAKTISVTNLLKIGDFLGLNDLNTLLEIYVSNLPKEAIADFERANRAKYIVQNFDIAGLKDVGFLSQTKDFNQIEDRIVGYFDLDSIFDYESNVGVVFSRSKGNPNQKMINFWLASARKYFHDLANPNDYNRDHLVSIIKQIKPYCQDEEKGLIIVTQALFKAGVSIVYQPYVPNTQIRGATIIVNDKPCIIITDLRKNYGTLWFTLMHELFHVLYDLEEIKSMNGHLSDEKSPDLLIKEYRADEFARNYFFGRESINYIKPFIGNHGLVIRQADKHEIHPAIIYNNFAWEMMKTKKKNFWPLVNKYSPDISGLLKKINRSMWDWENIAKEAVGVRETLHSLKK